jgi:hypothetical protein
MISLTLTTKLARELFTNGESHTSSISVEKYGKATLVQFVGAIRHLSVIEATEQNIKTLRDAADALEKSMKGQSK